MNELNTDDIINKFLIIIEKEKENKDIWLNRAVVLFFATIDVLNYLYNKNNVKLTISDIKKNLMLSKLIDLNNNKNIPQEIKLNLNNYLKFLPGYKINCIEQCVQTNENHMYLLTITNDILTNILKYHKMNKFNQI